MIPFVKMHGLGNDFIIVDCRDGLDIPSAETIRAMGDRKTGIGCDQFITLLPAKAESADVLMKITNAADGIDVEACGNATRCVASLLMSEKNKKAVMIKTVAGLLECSAETDDLRLISVNMGTPSVQQKHTLFGFDGQVVDVGNPHIVFFVDDVMGVDLETIGPQIENHDLFPKRINVEFAQIMQDKSIRMRVWERGEGITMACGTGACATLAAAVDAGYVKDNADVIMDGGMLSISWGGRSHDLTMSGPAVKVFQGSWAL